MLKNFSQRNVVHFLKELKSTPTIRQFSITNFKFDETEEESKPAVVRPKYHPSVIPRRRRKLIIFLKLKMD
jgi:hypothetical protein